MKILIIDDEQSLTKILTKFLEQNGYEAYPAYTGQEGLEKNDVLKPDVVLVDLLLPDISGMDLISKFNESSSNVSIVVITGVGSVDSAVQAMKKGAEDYLEKPIDLEKLNIVMKRIAEKRGPIAAGGLGFEVFRVTGFDPRGQGEQALIFSSQF